MQLVSMALSRALPSAGSNKPARIAMIAITMRSSMRVKPHGFTLRYERGERRYELEDFFVRFSMIISLSSGFGVFMAGGTVSP
jgi:hypothetical protein